MSSVFSLQLDCCAAAPPGIVRQMHHIERSPSIAHMLPQITAVSAGAGQVVSANPTELKSEGGQVYILGAGSKSSMDMAPVLQEVCKDLKQVPTCFKKLSVERILAGEKLGNQLNGVPRLQRECTTSWAGQRTARRVRTTHCSVSVAG